MRDLDFLDTARRGGAWRLLGLLLVPVLIAGAILAGTGAAEHRSTTVKAAVVNLDKAVEVNGQLTPIGRQLAAELVTAPAPNVTWVLSDAAGAADGLAKGEYAVVVTIPESFSADALSYALDDRHARRAHIGVERSQMAGAVDPTIAALLANEAAHRLNEFLASQYLGKVYEGFSSQGAQLKTVADAARQLSDGSRQLSDGLTPAAAGTKQLSDGLVQAGAGAKAVSDGVAQYTGGVDQTATGASTLNQGVAQYSSGVAQYTQGVSTYVDGAGQVATGAAGLSQGLTALQSTLAGLADPAAAQPIVAANVVPQVLPGAQQTAAGYEPQVTAAIMAQVPATPVPAIPAPTPDLAAMGAVCANAGIDPTVCAQVYGAGYAAGAQDMGTNVQTALGGLGQQMQAGTQQLVSSSVSAGLAAGAEVGVNYAATGGFVAGVTAAQQGFTTADPATGQTLAGGAQVLAEGAATLANGGTQLKQGGTDLANGAAQLAQGSSQLSDGLATASQNSAALRDGASQLSTGLVQASEQAPQLADGLGKLADGATKLADGAKQLADGLSQGATLPSYTEAERTALAQSVAAPVQVPGTTVALVSNPAHGLAWLVAALWAGALATFTVVRPLSRRLPWRNEGAATAVGRTLAAPLVVVAGQALLLGAVAAIAMELSFGRWAAVTCVLLVAAVAFTLVNHALAAWLGGAGRLVALAMLVFPVVVALTAAVPGWIHGAAGLSPVSVAMTAAASAGTGEPGARLALFALLGLAVVALVASAAAVVRARRAPDATGAAA